MSQYPFDETPPRKGSNAWFYVILVIVAAVVGGLFVQYMLPALQQPSSGVQVSVSPTPTPTAKASTTGSSNATANATATVANANEKIKGNIDLAEDATVPDMVQAVGSAVVGISNRTTIASKSGLQGSINGIPVPNNGSNSSRETEQGYGSGVIISPDGYIVTNAHVVDSASKLVVILAGGEEVEATLVGVDDVTDLAVLKIDKKNLTSISLGDSAKARVGETVLAIGNPMGQELYGSVSKGIISATNRQVTIDGHVYTMLQTDTAINAGNSGGALVNLKGELIGICSSKMVSAGTDENGNAISAEGLGFAIPISEAQPIINELMEKGSVERPVMGISGGFLTEQAAAYYNCPVGFVVQEVAPGSGAEAGGIKADDLITAIDGTAITSYANMSSIITSHKIGDTIKVTVWREGKTSELTVTLASSSNIKQTTPPTTTPSAQTN